LAAAKERLDRERRLLESIPVIDLKALPADDPTPETVPPVNRLGYVPSRKGDGHG
jgi:hypothetical protein